MPATPFNIAIAVSELGLLLTGLVLLWRFVVRPAARLPGQPDVLGPWSVSLVDFLLFAFLVFAAGLLGSVASGLLIGGAHLSADAKTVASSAGFQFGLLAGAALLPLNLGRSPLSASFAPGSFVSGAVVFLIALPVITVVNLVWLWLLQLFGVPAEQQDLLRLFTETDSALLLGVMVLLATVVAPIAEELLFRATMFRYLRTRVPRWLALLLPGTVFAALHVNWLTLDGLASFAPLVTLAVVFSLAYERTGRIGTAVVAHALFNLHTILLLFSGIMDEAPSSF